MKARSFLVPGNRAPDFELRSQHRETARLAAQFDHRRVLYASFAPVFDTAFERRRVRSARTTPEARRAIEGDNAVRLFGLDNPKA